MALSTLETGMKIESMVRANILGMTVVNTKETGKIIIWMDTVSIRGRMAENTKVSTRRTKSMEMVYTHGLMAVNMMASGRMEGSMEEVNIYQNKDNIGKAFGKTEKERDGSMEQITEYRVLDFKTIFGLIN